MQSYLIVTAHALCLCKSAVRHEEGEGLGKASARGTVDKEVER